MGSAKRNLLTSILLLVVMGVFAVLTIFIVVDAINKKYYNDIKVEYEVQEESPNIILTFARNEGSAYSTETVKAVRNPKDETKFRIDGTVPTIENGIVTNLDDLTSNDGREFYFFSKNSSFIDPQEDPENPDFIFSDTDSRYYVSTEDNPIWYDVPKSSENLTLYSVFLTPNVHNSDFANAPLLNTSPNVIISHDVVDIPYNAFSDMSSAMTGGEPNIAKIESVVIPNSVESINSEYDVETQIIGGAFAACTTLTNIIIPSSVEYVGGEAFVSCTGLDTVEYENGYYLSTENNEHAILIDTNLKAENVTIHEDCVSIQGDTFSKMMSIYLGLIPIPDISMGSVPEMLEILINNVNMNFQEITIPKNVKSIGFCAFAMCMGLTNVVFEGDLNLTNIGTGSFLFCSSLSKISIQIESVESFLENISKEVDENDPTTYHIIMKIAMGVGDPSIIAGISLNQNGQEITDIEIPDTMTEIPMYAFTGLNIKSISIPSSVTSIGNYAFAGCSSLTSIKIPESVTSIGNSAFYNCSGLETVNFGENPQLTSIGEDAFYNCSSLTSITIPEGVTSIGDSAFSSCDSLTSIKIPESVTSIGSYAFQYCSNLEGINLPEGINAINNYTFYGCSRLMNITIPESVTSIGNYVFYNCSGLETVSFGENPQLTSIGERTFYSCSSLTLVTIPESVTSIGNYAFSICSGLESVNFGENSQLTSIGNYAFSSCSSLSSITIPESATSIGNYAFYNCSSLETVNFGKNSILTIIGEGAFSACSSLTSITIPKSVTSIGNSVFRSCSSLTNITIPESVTSIGDYAFSSCDSLASIKIPEGVASIGERTFYSCSSLSSITIPESVTSIGNYAFYNCSSLTSIAIPESVTSIGNYAFYNCSSIETVHFGENSMLASIGMYAFYNCSSLTSITIPSNVTSIGDSAFRDCYKLVEVYDLTGSGGLKITKGRTDNGYVGYYAVEIKKEEGVTGIYYTGDNNEFVMYKDLKKNHYLVNYKGQGGNISLPTFDDARTYSIKRYAFYENLTITSIEILSSVTSIGDSAFEYCSSLTSIKIPSSVTSIGSYAFRHCYKLVEVYDLTGSEGLKITKGSTGDGYVGYYADYVYTDKDTDLVQKEVGGYIFYYNNGVMYLLGYTGSDKELTLPSIDKVKESTGFNCDTYVIYEYAFRDNINITSVTILDGVTSIGNYAFKDCSSLTSITIPEGVTSIGDYAFYGCSSLTSITIPSSVTSIGEEAFYICSNIQELRIGDLTSYLNILYSDDDYSRPLNYANQAVNLYVGGKLTTNLEISSGVTTIPAHAFAYVNITSVTIPSSVTSIGEHAFEDCISLKTVNFGEKSMLTSIGDYAFEECSNLTSITIPSGVTSIGTYAFEACSSLETVNFGEKSMLTSIGNFAFSSCDSLTSITIPSGVTNIETYAFHDCISLETVNFGENSQLTSIGNYAFYSCESLTSVTIPSGVTSIGNYAFHSCDSITSITIPEGVTSIGNSAFSYCINLTSIIIPEGVTSIGDSAFMFCINLTIYCEVSSLPSGWSSSWSRLSRDVYWAGEWKMVDGLPVPKE